MELTKLEELVIAVLNWWDIHQFDTDRTGEYNIYNDPPEFVQIALDLQNKT